MLNILPERIALARREGPDYADFLQIVLADEVSRRDHGRLELRLRQAGFEQICRLEDFDCSAQVPLDRLLPRTRGRGWAVRRSTWWPGGFLPRLRFPLDIRYDALLVEILAVAQIVP